ncbi:MAG: alpha/beta hydrolase [Bacilli bacterium]
MIKKINGLNVNYINYGKKGKTDIVLLHGWGQNISMMRPIGDCYSKDFMVTIIDLPGFGDSEEPNSVWTLFDYVNMLSCLLNELNIKNPILIGHSFGGKISLLYASMYPVKKLILMASPFRPGVKKLSLKTRILKTAKKLPGMDKIGERAKKYIGSTDYKNSSPIMRAIMVEHVNLDLTLEVSRIKCPTILIWGDMDTEASINEGYMLENIIPDAAVVVYPGCTHYAYLERLEQTISVINSFIKE